MRKPQVEKQRARLEELRDRLSGELGEAQQEIREYVEAPGDISHVPTHAADHDSEGVDERVETAHAEGEMLVAVRHALERMENGSYGTCESCGREISAERLDAVPYATKCVPCERDGAGG